MKESAYQAQLIKQIRDLLPGCLVLKNDPARNQGIPDLLILYHDRWAMLEVKIKASAARRPNQDYFVKALNDLSYAAFIYPENEQEVLCDLQSALGAVG